MKEREKNKETNGHGVLRGEKLKTPLKQSFKLEQMSERERMRGRKKCPIVFRLTWKYKGGRKVAAWSDIASYAQFRHFPYRANFLLVVAAK